MTLDSASIVRRVPSALGTDVADLHVLLSDDLRYLGLNPVAKRIWDLVEVPMPFGAIVNQLVSEYEVSEEQCSTESSRLLEQLAEYKLVEIGP